MLVIRCALEEADGRGEAGHSLLSVSQMAQYIFKLTSVSILSRLVFLFEHFLFC